jgi:6-phosphogluconolactonase (cycloisomerase 2 family)
LETTPRSKANTNFYAAVGTNLIHFIADIGKTTLHKKATINLGLNIQYIWRHPKASIIYIALSNGGPGKKGTTHKLVSYTLDKKTGVLKKLLNSSPLQFRPLHISIDKTNEHILVAYNNPSAISAHKIEGNGSIGQQVEQGANLDVGIFGHQIMAAPDGETVILVCRGHDADIKQDEQPGALKVFKYANGKLTFDTSIEPEGGFGFGARHLDFHHNGKWIYLGLERQSELHLFKIKNGSIDKISTYKTSTLSKPVPINVRQAVSAVHIHPSGNFVYVSNRTYGLNNKETGAVIPYGEDNIAVFEIDKETGKTKLIQHISTTGSLPRTFSIDPSGKMLIAANSENAKKMTPENKQESLPLSLAIYEIQPNGLLDRKGTVEFPEQNQLLFWSGFL